MELFDTHCHFESSDPGMIRPVLERARTAGVTRLVAVGGSDALNASACAAFRLAAAAPGTMPVVSVALGYDREQVGKGVPSDGFAVDGRLPAAWGEIGLDYHYAPETRDAQCALFAAQLDAARRLDLPVVIHTREADDDTLALLRAAGVRGVVHSFTGSADFARRLLDLGLYVSLSGIVTFRAADNVREMSRVIPDDRLLIETDAPFLAPVPMRGRPNESAFVVHTCRFLAALRGVDESKLAALTFANAERIFGIISKS